MYGYYKNFIMTAGSDDLSYGRGDAYISKIGLAGSHAYSVLGVYEIIKTKNGYVNVPINERAKYLKNGKKLERIIKLRNPWGKGEWKGKWNDKDKNWNKNLSKELGMKIKEDGMFFMDFESFVKYFSDF